jgi:hypothetical protein
MGGKSAKDARGLAKAQRQSSLEAKQCVVCGRWFSKRRDQFCSQECAEKAGKGNTLSRDKPIACGRISR